jgi:hypothetical protein
LYKYFVNIFVFTISIISSVLFAQINLVPNPSFENVIQCPFAFGIEDYVSDWKSARETPDYFNSCATWWGASVPTNIYGHQQAYTGNAYIGMLTYRSDSSIYTEAASVQLNSDLTLGSTYYVSFKVSLALENSTGSMAANNKIGIQFSTTDYFPSNPIPINNFAHVWTDSIITDTLNWTIIKGSFVADSTYTHLNLGNFFDKQYMDSITYGGVFGAYYYFDDICVSTDSTLCYQTVGLNEIQSNQFLFNIYPNPVTDYFNVNQPFKEPYDLIIYNSLGQQLYQEKNIITNNKTINTTSFTKGILFIIIKTNKQTINYKLLKQ